MSIDTIVTTLNSLIGKSILVSAFLCFLGGVLASLTPCLYPLIPVVASYVGSKSVHTSKTNSFFMSLSYVMGMGVVYSLLGIFAAITGTLFGRIATNPISYFCVGNLFLLLGLNVLDIIHLPVISPKNSEKKGILGAFLVGAASGLITSPCTTPILGAILFYVASTKSILWGSVLMFSFSMGMGMLLVIVGTFSGILTSLPKPGTWMEKIKKFLAFLLILIGEYFLIKTGQMM